MDFATIELEVRARLGETVADFWSSTEIKRAINGGVQHFCAEERWPWLYTEGSDTTLLAGAETMPLPVDVSINRVFGLVLATGLTTSSQVYKPERLTPDAGWRARKQEWGRTSTPRYYYIVKGTNTATQDILMWRGTWSGVVTYVPRDVVVDAGVTYVCIATTLNNQPPNVVYWTPLASYGAGVTSPTLSYTVRFVPALDLAYDAYFTYMRVPATLTAGTDEPDIPEEYQEAVIAWATGRLWLKELAWSQKATEQFVLYRDILDQAQRELRRPTTDEVVAWGREQPGEMQDVDRDAWLRGMGPLGP